MCDINESRLKHLQTLYPEVEGVTDYQHLLNGMDLDAIVIATAVKHHYGLAKAALLAGKHTLIEKPMASSSAECEELIDIAESQRARADGWAHLSLFVGCAEDRGHRPGRRHRRYTLYQFPTA